MLEYGKKKFCKAKEKIICGSGNIGKIIRDGKSA